MLQHLNGLSVEVSNFLAEGMCFLSIKCFNTNGHFPSLPITLISCGFEVLSGCCFCTRSLWVTPGTIFRTGSSDSSLGVDVRRVSLWDQMVSSHNEKRPLLTKAWQRWSDSRGARVLWVSALSQPSRLYSDRRIPHPQLHSLPPLRSFFLENVVQGE